MGRDVKVRCPHCSHQAKIRTSRPLSALTREAYYQCQNVKCGFVWAGHISAVRTIVPSMTPNPEIFIPMHERPVAIVPGVPSG